MTDGSLASPPSKPPRNSTRLRNLQRRRATPAAGRGRIQRAVARAFDAAGPELSASVIYQWARRWQRRHDGAPINQAERWSIRRALLAVADPTYRAGTIGRPWVW